MANFTFIAKLQDPIENSARAVVDALLGAHTMKFYDGGAPSSPDVSISEQNLLVTLPFWNPPFLPPHGGVMRLANPIFGRVTHVGVCTWARIADAAGNTICDCDVGPVGSSATVTMDDTSFEVLSEHLRVTDFNIRVPFTPSHPADKGTPNVKAAPSLESADDLHDLRTAAVLAIALTAEIP